MLCVSVQSDDREQLKVAAEKGDIVEVRVDGISFPDISELTQSILTLRSVDQGGLWSGTLEEKEALYEQLAALGPTYLDLESDTRIEFVDYLQRQYPEVQILLSHHDLKETPNDLETVLQRMRCIPAAIYKLVFTAHNTIDALRVLLFSRKAGSDVTAFAMEEAGAVTRILGPVVDNPLIYACLNEAEPLAPGQLSVDTLKEVYHINRLSSSSTVCALIGDPITYSISHITHNSTFNDLGLDAVYVRMRVKKEELSDSLNLVKVLGFRGLSVTIPLKELVIPLINEVDSVAREIGAVNTLTFDDGKIKGGNTDADGALDAIEEVQKVSGKKVVIIGAGGSARAVAYEAKKRGADVLVVARREEQAKELGGDLQVEWGVLSRLSESYDILVNATPSEQPVDFDLIRPGCLAMDLKSKPRNTAFLQAAREKNCICVDGVAMFTRQATGQFSSWFEINSLECESKLSHSKEFILYPRANRALGRLVLFGRAVLASEIDDLQV